MAKANAKKAHGATEYPQTVQDRFLTQMVKEHTKVAVFLVNGIKLEGEITAYDDYVLLIQGSALDHVYKHAISAIQPVIAGSASHDPQPRKERPRPTVVVRRARPKLENFRGGEGE